MRHLIDFEIEVWRLAEQLAFQLPELVRFDATAGFHTFADFDFTELITQFDGIFHCLTNLLDQLDPDLCITTDRPFDGWDPVTNHTLPPAEDQFPPPARWQYDCGRDGLGYHRDSREYIYLLPTTQNNTAVYCDIFDPTGCELMIGQYNGSLYYLTVKGQPPLENVNISVSPKKTGHTPYPVYFATATDYAITVPASGAPYGVSGAITTDCTVAGPPPALPDPITPGVGCWRDGSSAGILMYRPLEVPPALPGLVSYMGEVLTNPGNATVACGYDFPPTISTTDVATFFKVTHPIYGTHLVMYIDPATNAITPVYSILGVPVRAQNSMCRYNQLYYLPAGDTSNATIMFLAGYPQAHIPCVINPPTAAAWTCTANATGPPTVDAGTHTLQYCSANNLCATKADIPCTTNPLIVEPLCSAIAIAYTDGSTVLIRIEGSNIDVTFNASMPEEFVCESISPTASAASAGTYATKFTQVVSGAYARVAAREAAKTTHDGASDTPRVPAADMRYMPPPVQGSFYLPPTDPPDTYFRKESLVCCLSEAISFLADFIGAVALEILMTARGILAVFAVGIAPTILYIPTFEGARDDLQTALCRLMCAITRLLPLTISCDKLNEGDPEFKCTNAAECSQGVLCAAVAVLMDIISIFVQVLQTIRQLVTGDLPASSLTDSAECRTLDDAVGCLTNMVVNIIIDVVFSVTALARSAAAWIDCILCALTVAIAPAAPCQDFIYQFVDALATLIDGIANDLLPLIVKMLVILVKMVIDLFSCATLETNVPCRSKTINACIN